METARRAPEAAATRAAAATTRSVIGPLDNVGSLRRTNGLEVARDVVHLEAQTTTSRWPPTASPASPALAVDVTNPSVAALGVSGPGGDDTRPPACRAGWCQDLSRQIQQCRPLSHL